MASPSFTMIPPKDNMPSCVVVNCPNANRKDIPVFYMMLNRCGHAEWLQKNIKETLNATDVFTVCESHTYQSYMKTIAETQKAESMAEPSEKCTPPPTVDNILNQIHTVTNNEIPGTLVNKEQEDPSTYMIPGPSTSGVKIVTKNVLKRQKTTSSTGPEADFSLYESAAKKPKTIIETQLERQNIIVEKGQNTKLKEHPKTDSRSNEQERQKLEAFNENSEPEGSEQSSEEDDNDIEFYSSEQIDESESDSSEQVHDVVSDGSEQVHDVVSDGSEQERNETASNIQGIKVELSDHDYAGTFDEGIIVKEEPEQHNEEEVIAPEPDTTATNPLFIGLEDVKQEADPDISIDIGETVIQKTADNTIPSDILVSIFDQYVTKKAISREDVKFLLSLPFDTACVSNSRCYMGITEFTKYLYICSEKVYKSIAENYIPSLPSEEKILQEWMSEGWQGGFSKAALDGIKNKVSMANSNIFCSLQINHIFCSSMIFMITAVAVNASWKVPIFYSVLDTPLDGMKRAKIVQFAVNLLEKSGVFPISVSYHPVYQNSIMAEYFTPNLERYCEKIIYSKKGRKIYLLPDPVFMLENFGWGLMKDKNDKIISMRHVELLVNHLNSVQAGQLSSRLIGKSVAHSLLLCQNDIKDSGLADVSGTAEFLMKLNNLIDILTSHKDGKGLKQAPNRKNMKHVDKTLMQLLEYFSSLSVPCKKEVFSRKLNYGHNLDMSSMLLNLMTAICSASALISNVVGYSLPYLDMIKLSMASTMFVRANFSKVFNYGFLGNIPYFDFISRYRNNVKFYSVTKTNNKNTLPLEKVSLINVMILTPIQIINLTTYQKNSNCTKPIEKNIQDDLFKILRFDSSEFEEQSLIYIAGYIVYKLVRTLRCDTCINALLRPNPHRQFEDKYVTELVIRKPIYKMSSKLCLRLMEPSYEVIKLCKLAETLFRRSVLANSIFSAKKFMMVEFPANMIGKDFFKDLDFHRMDGDVLYNHVVELPKAIVEVFLKIRLEYKCRRTRCFLKNTVWGLSTK